MLLRFDIQEQPKELNKLKELTELIKRLQSENENLRGQIEAYQYIMALRK